MSCTPLAPELAEPVLGDSGCITGKPCTLGCSLFCALEPADDDADRGE